MALPRAVARDLRDTARKIARIHDPVVADAAEFAIAEASRVGGSMMGGRYQLYAKVTKVSNRADRSTATVAGVSAGFWAIKSRGRRGGYTIRGRRGPLNLLGDSGSPDASVSVTPGPARGDGRWDRVVEATAEHSEDVFLEAVERAVS